MYQKQERLGSNKLGPRYVLKIANFDHSEAGLYLLVTTLTGESVKGPNHYSLTSVRNNMQEWVPTTVCLLILFRTKDAWTRTHEDSSFSIDPPFKPYTRPRTPHRVLVMVVWWDVVIATPFPVQYQAEQCHSNGIHAKHDFLEKVTLKV